MTVLAVLTVTVPSFCLSYKIQYQEPTMTVLMGFSGFGGCGGFGRDGYPLKLNPPFSNILILTVRDLGLGSRLPSMRPKFPGPLNR